MTTDKTPPERAAGALVRPFLSGASNGAGDQADLPVPDGALRPFLLTAGRVAGQDSIAIETQVVTTESGRTAVERLGFERRDIVSLCGDPLSVAEIAAQLSLHLGVVRVLVGDLSADGHLSVYLPNSDASTDVDTLLRVIRGLRSIG
ncbi:MAG TPA: DUF742 domain-containing protein [Mycobacteriales bacterium]|nr:DUF742 domain-containing protein [Mycobacteriales bacterium]HVD29819.1 DUF742 domain-containing protein [Mycobacteriales bacterium]